MGLLLRDLKSILQVFSPYLNSSLIGVKFHMEFFVYFIFQEREKRIRMILKRLPRFIDG